MSQPKTPSNSLNVDQINKLFCMACIRGEMDQVKLLLAQSPLATACFGQVSPEHVDQMAQMDAADGWTPMHLAAHYGQAAIVEFLLIAGANINARAENAIGNTPLMAAIAGGHLQLAETLLRRGADPTLSDRNGVSAAQLALANGHMEFAEKLLRLKPWGQ